MSLEQLAEKLDVSRQVATEWEGYPMKMKISEGRTIRTAGISLPIGRLAIFASGCGAGSVSSAANSEQAESADAESVSESVSADAGSDGETDAVDTVSESTEAASTEKESDHDGFTVLFTQKTSIEQTVLYDQDNIRITADDLKYENNQAELDLTLENNTEQDLSFVTGSIGYGRNSINGYMTDGIWLNEDVSAGMKSAETIYLDTDMLELLGVTDIADITLDFQISDADYNTVAETGPLQIRTNLADTWDYSKDTYADQMTAGSFPGGLSLTLEDYQAAELYSQNDVKILSSALVTVAGEKTLLLEMENDSSSDAEIVVSNIAMNSLTVCDTTWDSYFIRPGCRGLIDLNFETLLYDTNSDALGLDVITSLSFTAALQDGNGNDLAAPADVSIQLSDSEGTYDSSGEEIYSQNGIRIVSKGVTKGAQSYDEDLHLLFLVENSSCGDLFLQVDGSSVSVNNAMIDSFGSVETISAGANGSMDIDLMSDSLAKNGITGPDDIRQVSMKLTIYDENYNTIDEPTLTVSYEK